MTLSHWILGSIVILESVPLYNNISTYLLYTGFVVMHTPYNLKFHLLYSEVLTPS